MEELRCIVDCLPTPAPRPPDPRATKASLDLSRNLCYVAVGVVMEGVREKESRRPGSGSAGGAEDDKKGRVVMIQEGMPSCRGKWYLPAGLVDEGETMQVAACREFVEESGLEMRAEALVAVECNTRRWVRFTFTGSVSGGKLKTKEDHESMQGAWLPVHAKALQKKVPLRGEDIFLLMDIAKEWYGSGRPFSDNLPVAVAHVSSSIRVVLAYATESELQVLMRKASEGHSSSFPVCVIARDSVTNTLHHLLQACGYRSQYDLKGALSVEHFAGKAGEHDGFCLTLLVGAASAGSQGLDADSSYHWVALPGTGEAGSARLTAKLRAALESRFGCAKVIDI